MNASMLRRKLIRLQWPRGNLVAKSKPKCCNAMAHGNCLVVPGIASFLQTLRITAGSTLDFLAGYKDELSALETLCKIAALIIGAIWAWKGYVRNRLRFPSATLEHLIASWTEENKTFLHVKVRITNTG